MHSKQGFLFFSPFFAWRRLLVPLLLHLILNSTCQKKLLLLVSSDEGRRIWSRVTEAAWWTVWACSLPSLRKSLCLCALSAYLWCALKKRKKKSPVWLYCPNKQKHVTRSHTDVDPEDCNVVPVTVSVLFLVLLNNMDFGPFIKPAGAWKRNTTNDSIIFRNCPEALIHGGWVRKSSSESVLDGIKNLQFFRYSQSACVVF